MDSFQTTLMVNMLALGPLKNMQQTKDYISEYLWVTIQIVLEKM